jgi:hypothetical protein
VVSKTNCKRASDDTASFWNELGRVAGSIGYFDRNPNYFDGIDDKPSNINSGKFPVPSNMER